MGEESVRKHLYKPPTLQIFVSFNLKIYNWIALEHTNI